MNRLTDDAICDQEPEQDTNPGSETEDTFPPTMLLQAFRTAAQTTSQAHEKATGFPNDALVSYIQAVQQQAGCPAKAS